VLLVGSRPQPVQRLAEPAEPEPQRMPGVAEADRPAQAGVAVAADPDRYRAAAVVLVVGPRRAHRAHRAQAERDAERVELLPRPADAHAQDQPAPAEVVQVGGHPRDEQGCRYGAISTVVPSRTALVRPASQASVVNGS
jgi:hypothetical protein